jgi:hypothetical protein
MTEPTKEQKQALAETGTVIGKDVVFTGSEFLTKKQAEERRKKLGGRTVETATPSPGNSSGSGSSSS